MIQFNLLPDVKLGFIKAQRTKHLAITISIICSLVALGILLILLVTVYGVQKKSLNDLNKDTAKYTAQIKNTKDLNKVLTIQNQLKALPGLESKRPDVARLFNYLTQTTPNQASISNLSIDFGQNSWTLSGTADTLATVNKLVDTYKFTTYSVGTNSKAAKAFSNVVLTSFGVSSTTNATNPVSFAINENFAPDIFDSTKNVTLTVPNIISTRSETQQPQLLFNQPANNQSSH